MPQSSAIDAPSWVPQGPTGAPLVFVVEDNPELARCFGLLLQRGGFRSVSTETADDALEGIRVLRPALVIVDLWLRIRQGAKLNSGADLVRALSRDPLLRHLPVLVVTGDARAETVAALACGGAAPRAVQIVTKPEVVGDLSRLPNLVRQSLSA
ncbi:MAG: two-component system response regulator [Candidatus Methylomirabilia bacterium]